MKNLILLAVAAALLLSVAPAQAQQRNPFETREDAWKRQQSERYQFEQRNPNSLNPPAGRLGDTPVRPTQQEQNRWGGGASQSSPNLPNSNRR